MLSPPPLATKPPCEIHYDETTGACSVVTDDALVEAWDKETVRSVRHGETLGKSFRNRWAFVDVSCLIAQMLLLTQKHKLQHPKDILIPLVKKHIRNRDGEAEMLLEGFNIDGIEEVWEGGEITGFSLPITRNGTPAYQLLYNLQGGDTKIPMRDGTTVYVKVSKDIKDILKELSYLKHDVNNALIALGWGFSFYQRRGYTTPQLQELLDFSNEVSSMLEEMYALKEEPDKLEEFTTKLKAITKRSQTQFAYPRLKAIFEEVYSRFSDDDRTIDKREAFVDIMIASLLYAKNTLSDYSPDFREPPKPVSLNALIDSVRSLQANILKIAVRDYTAGDIEIITDEAGLTRALTNIVINASEAINENRSKGGFRIRTQFTSDKKYVEIILSDTAGGIPSEVLQHIFERGFTTKVFGKGLGLAITKEYIEKRCGGTIDVQSEVGKGTTFTIRLPITQKAQGVSEDEFLNLMKRKDGNIVLLDTDCSIAELFGLSQQDLNGKDVLVIGCGGGTYCFSAVLKGAHRAIGVDIDENSIAVARLLAPFIHSPLLKDDLIEYLPKIRFDNAQRVIKSMPSDADAKEQATRVEPSNLEFIATNATDLSAIQSNSLDAVAIPYLLAVSDGILDEQGIYDTLKEAVRVLRPSGTLYVKPSFPREQWEYEPVRNIYAMGATDEEHKAMFSLVKVLSSLEQEGVGGKRLVRVSGKKDLLRVEATQTADVGSYNRSSSSGQSGVAEKVVAESVVVSPESERIHTTNVEDTLTYIQTQPQTQPLIVALGTSWIKGYEKGRYLQYDALNPLLASLRTYCESKGIPFVIDDDDKLLARINAEKAKDGRSGAKVVVLAGKDTVASDEFATLRNDEKNAFVVGVDNQELTTDSYIRLMEMLTLALKLSAGLEVSLDNAHITITRDNERHLYIFLPHAEPMDYEKLRQIYRVQEFA